MTDDQKGADDLPDLTRGPPELEHLIAGLPDAQIEYVNGRWYVCQPGQVAQPISLCLRPPRPSRPRVSRSASAA
jgi:hypothetical protein